MDKLELAKKLLFHIDMKLLIDRKVLSRSCRINCFLDYEQTDENYIDHIQKVTKDDVISMANKAELDTIYVLTKGIILNEGNIL